MNASTYFLNKLNGKHLILPRRAVSIFLVFLLVASAAAQVSPPAGSVSLGSPLRPVFTVAPGEVHLGEIVLVNNGGQAATVQVSQVDYFPNGGSSIYPEPGSLPRSNARWIELAATEVQVPAGMQVVVPYTIAVPHDASLAGSYWSMIFVMPSDGASVQAAQEAEVRTSVRTQFRYGISVVTTVGNSGVSQLGFASPQFTRQENSDDTFLQVGLENTGERLLSPELWLELYDMNGALLNRFEGSSSRIFPGDTVRAQFGLGSLAEGSYQAIVMADAGADAIFGARYTLNITAP